MPVLFIYLLKVNLVLILFYLAYRFLLRPLTFHYLNRYFLLVGVCFSSVYPFIDVAGFLQKHGELGTQIAIILPDWKTNILSAETQNTINYWYLLELVFWSGVALMAIRLTIQFISLYRIHRNSVRDELQGRTFRNVSGELNPFSFWKNIYLNPAQYKGKELEAILKHEEIHVKEWHTLDVLIAELSTVFYWFNPGAWLTKQAVKENLEFITDHKILQTGTDTKSYQYSLLHFSAISNTSPLVNNFNFLTLKKRIIMMNKKRSSAFHATKYVLVMPLVIALALAVNISKAEIERIKIFIPELAQNQIDTKSNDSIRYIINGIPADTAALKRIDPNNIKSIYVLKGKNAIKAFGDSMSDGVVALFTKDGDSPIAQAALVKLTAKELNSDGKSISATIKTINTPLKGAFINNTDGALILLDGKEVSESELGKLSADDIQSVDVNKSEEAKKSYGEKSKNGVINTYSKKK